jgi:hypothetical protein
VEVVDNAIGSQDPVASGGLVTCEADRRYASWQAAASEL